MPKSPQTELYYVHVSQGSTVRRAILEASKLLIECLRRYERFKAVRAARMKSASDLANVFKEINEITAQMRIEMPRIKIPNVKIVEEKKVQQKPARPVPVQVQPEEQDELKKLEAAIADIEARLGDM
jgi:hypothetical protein